MQPADFDWAEPPQVVMLLRFGVGGPPAPASDDEGVLLEVRIGSGEGEGPSVEYFDAELFSTLPAHRLLRGLAGLDVATRKIPTVRIVLPPGMAVHEEDPAIVNERRDRNLNRSASSRATTNGSAHRRSQSPDADPRRRCHLRRAAPRGRRAGAQADQAKRRSRRLFPTTNSELRAMAAPAIIGFSMPSAASGIAATL